MLRHRRLAAGAIAPLLLAMLGLTGCPDNPKEHRVAVLFTTDEHSHVFAIAPEVDDWPLAATTGTGALVGGMARRATLISQQRAAMSDTVVLSSGDSTQGTLATVPFALANFDLQLMKAMGYDAVALGNHEFDQTPVGLAMAVSAARGAGSVGAPQLVLTNLKFSATHGDKDDTLAALYGAGKAIAPSHVVTTPGGYKVGVVAAMGLSAAADCAPFAAPVTFTDGQPTSSGNALTAIVAQVQPAVDALRNDSKVDVVVLLSHGGVGEGQVGREDEALAARLTGLDLVLSGHSHAAAQPVRYVNDPTGHKVALLQTSPYGTKLGRAELVWLQGDRPRVDTDPAKTTYLSVDDRTLPTTNPTVIALINGMIDALETGPTSFLAQTLTAVLGAPPTAGARGSLYFYPLGKTTFPVRGTATGESNMLNLDTDAMLAAANLLAGAGSTQVALQARGAMRADFNPGKTGVLSFADVYRAAPLGIDPSGNPGYPILRFLLLPVQLRAALEGTLLMDLQNPDYFVTPAGLKVTYDRTRAMFNTASPGGPGSITRMATVDAVGAETPFYDVALSPTGWLLDPVDGANAIPVAASYQLAAFAQGLAIYPINPATGQPVTTVAGLESLFLRYPCSGASACPAVKDHQALASYVAQICAGNGGELPSRYDDATTTLPRRMVCMGADCPVCTGADCP